MLNSFSFLLCVKLKYLMFGFQCAFYTHSCKYSCSTATLLSELLMNYIKSSPLPPSPGFVFSQVPQIVLVFFMGFRVEKAHVCIHIHRPTHHQRILYCSAV